MSIKMSDAIQTLCTAYDHYKCFCGRKKIMKLIHDITPARDNWDRNYAKIEYHRLGLLRPFGKTIEVRHE